MSRTTQYLFALAATALAIALRWALDPAIGDELPFITVFGAVAAAVVVGGVGPAILSVVIGYLGVAYFFIEPRWAIHLQTPVQVVGLLAYLFTTGLITALGEVARRARIRSVERSEVLRVTLASIGDAVITTDLRGHVTYLNAVAEQLTGWTPETARDQPLARVFNIINEDTRQVVESPAIRALREGAIVGLANHTILVRRDGHEVAIDDSAAPIRNERGEVSGCVLIFRDVSDRRRLERAATERLEAASLLASIVESSDDAIIRKSLDGIIESWNAGAERLFGYTADEAIGRHVSLVIPPDRLAEEDGIIEALKAGRRVDHFETERRRRDGSLVQVSLTISPIRDDAGRIVGASKIARDITESRRLEEHLRKMATSLAETDRRKDEFLATLAHELRNPLAPLRHALELIRSGGAEGPRRQQALDTMDRQLSQMVRLVDDLLDVNRVVYNRLELRPVTLELCAIVQQAVEISQPLADAAGHRLHVSNEAGSLHVKGDPVRLSQVFANLLNNSCKYTPPGGDIWISCTREGGDAVIRVKDSGAGIPADKLEYVFDMFSQIDMSPERAQGGLGIGLTLARRLVKLHGGTVEVRSEGAGQGSEFIVRLPVVEAAPEVADPAEPAPAAAAPSRRVLVVDDNRDAAESLSMLLEHGGHQTYIAHDGPAALAAAEEHRPEVILLDIGMPVMNGHDVCREIRKQPWGGDVRVIALTGWGQEEDRRRSREAGFDGHLVKPVDYPALLRQLAEPRGNA